jgi:adenylate cyclase
VVLATTEVGENGSTRIFGGDTGLEYSRGIPSHAGFPEDPGGVVRRIEFEIQDLISLSRATAEAFRGTPVETPADDSAWIDFPGPPGTVETIPFWRVEAGRFEPGTFAGKIAVVGAFATSLQDLHATAVGEDSMPGAEIHAAAVDTALRGYPLGEVPWWVNVLVIAALAVLAPLLSLRISAIRAVVATLAAAVAFAVAAQLLFNSGEIVTVFYPLLAAAISSALALILYGLLSAVEREKARDAFARFVPETVVGQVLDQADGVRLGGVSATGTVLFSDLRGFTSFAEKRQPAEVIEILNRYLAAMSDAIMDNGGTLVSYMGDGIMAIFGAPVGLDDHADRAVAASREMLSRLDEFNDWMLDEGVSDGFKMGIGLNTGAVMAGNVGSERRLEYTAIGDTTNTAARIEGMTKGTPWQLYLADSTREALRAPLEELDQVGDFEVRGRRAKIKLWTLPSTRYRSAKQRRAGSKRRAKRAAKA